MTSTPHGQPVDTPVSQLLQQTLTNVQSLLRSELQLAKTEVSDDAKRLGAGGGLLAAGALLGLYAFGMLLNAVVEMLEEVMPDWLAALTLSIALGVLGGALAMAGQKRIKNVDIVPRETLASLREDVEVVDPRG